MTVVDTLTKNKFYYEKNTAKEKERVWKRKLALAKAVNDYKLKVGCESKDKCLSKNISKRARRRLDKKLGADPEFIVRRKRNFVMENYAVEPSDVGLEFHHKDPNEKFKEISLMVYHGYSLKRIFDEIKKCVVLCRKCHMELYHTNHDDEDD